MSDADKGRMTIWLWLGTGVTFGIWKENIFAGIFMLALTPLIGITLEGIAEDVVKELRKCVAAPEETR